MEIELFDTRFDVWPLGMLILIVLLYLKWRRKEELPYLICFLIFGVYILEVVKLTFFPLAITGSFAEASRADPEWLTYINLIPFSVGKAGYDNLGILQFAQNILLMLPFGFGVNFVARVRRKDFIWLPFAIGFGIEFGQLIISLLLGYPYRVVDITDALLNGLGVLLGYILFRIFSYIYVWISRETSSHQRGIFAYIQEITTRSSTL